MEEVHINTPFRYIQAHLQKALDLLDGAKISDHGGSISDTVLHDQ
ncbi:hypothetical protein [Paenibacillus sp. Y412MC10]|nr:hypothetical protein [Paenibacillus sp. Y412MC10]